MFLDDGSLHTWLVRPMSGQWSMSGQWPCLVSGLYNNMYNNTPCTWIIMPFLDRCIIPLLTSKLGHNDLYIPRLRLGIYKTLLASVLRTSANNFHYVPVLRWVTVYYNYKTSSHCSNVIFSCQLLNYAMPTTLWPICSELLGSCDGLIMQWVYNYTNVSTVPAHPT